LKFGGALVFSGIAAVLLVNLEKLVLVKTTSVETLAYYSLAFTLAMMATMFAQAMIQSLIPAFSQLLAPQKLEQLQGLFSRSMRLILIALVPTLAILFVVAKPIFIYMGGEDFGRESTGPFRLLLFGLLFNILAFTPYSLLMASGRADIFAKLYWIELMPYVGLIAFLTIQFGALGAAAAWSIRVIADALVIGRIAIRSTDVSFAMFEGRGWGFVFAVLLFIPPLAISALLEEHFIWPFIIMPISLLIYTIVMWENFIDITERAWIISRLHSVTGK
jgi:O-antigen/teichoic acid export membrane protein